MVSVLELSFQVSAALVRVEEAGVEAGVEVEGGFSHQPALLHESVRNLAVRPGGFYIDCTVGEGGHASAILQAAMPGGQLLGIDLDPHALERARKRLQPFGTSFAFAKGTYSQITQIVGALGFPGPDGVLLDLGLSSLQLENVGRGFSFQREAPLDMRFDPKATLTAAHILNTYPMDKLTEIISQYGEEPRARAIARTIVRRRPLSTTTDLADLVLNVYGGRRGRTHPATRTFQALRIAVNSELDNLKTGLQQVIALLEPGGRLVVISYHSLEDRIVKGTLLRETKACICPPEIPVCDCGHVPSMIIISKKIVTPSPEEIKNNPRSRSARMRVAERV